MWIGFNRLKMLYFILFYFACRHAFIINSKVETLNIIADNYFLTYVKIWTNWIWHWLCQTKPRYCKHLKCINQMYQQHICTETISIDFCLCECKIAVLHNKCYFMNCYFFPLCMVWRKRMLPSRGAKLVYR